jgi:UDP-galactopyranose mutase
VVFLGSVLARELADSNKLIKIIDSRDHIGGNAYDKKDDHGIIIHPYGPHIFHTNSEKIFKLSFKIHKMEQI